MKLIGLLVLLGLIPSMEGEVIPTPNNPNNRPFGPCVGSFLNDQSILPPGMVRPQYQQICQRHKNHYRYATLYDTHHRIPVYSAYHYTGFTSLKRRTTWWIEPQLDVADTGNNAAMNTEASTGQQTVPTGPVGDHQAINNDYIKKNNPLRYEKGHLYPNCENCDKIQADSTFTLTNAAPQAPKDNKQWFHKVEKKLRIHVAERCTMNAKKQTEAYIVTGVTPGLHLLNERVSIPSQYWSAFCCRDKTSQNRFISEGYVMQMNMAGTGQLDIYGSAQGAKFTFAQLNNRLGMNVFGMQAGCS